MERMINVSIKFHIRAPAATVFTAVLIRPAIYVQESRFDQYVTPESKIVMQSILRNGSAES
jgi:hypothetical protein